MSVASILLAHGLVPVLPGHRRGAGTSPTSAVQPLPTVPSVPAGRNLRAVRFDGMRWHLLMLAERHGFDMALVRGLPDLDVAACLGLSNAQLAAFLQMLGDTATRWAGRVPAGHTAPIHCHQCGPVWMPPSIAACLPVVNGWPRSLGCPWCAVRKAGVTFPRPPALDLA